ncbi:tetratricopeptide repeat protein [Dactylosporangium sp. CA-233914]|uniref:tetratricopeptide repeat protein n=1 Tax=Dactylosporangium sp. CA-233914 TaxID=3239934 RepID=UPI003D8C281A
MRIQRVTTEMLGELWLEAQRRPDSARPALAAGLMAYAWRAGLDRPERGLPYLEEAADVMRSLLADGGDEHVDGAFRVISRLALQYSRAHADELALAARQEAVALARRAAPRPADVDKKALLDLARGLAEAGRFAEAVTVQTEVVELYRDRGAGDSGALWALLGLAVYLDRAGRSEASLEADREALARMRQMAAEQPVIRPTLAIRMAGFALWFTAAAHPREAGELLREAAAICAGLPAVGSPSGVYMAIQAAHFARSGARAEPAAPGGLLQPVLGQSMYHWSFSVRESYRAGLDAIDQALAAQAGDSVALGDLLRRRAIRVSVLFDEPDRFHEDVMPTLDRAVVLERRLRAADPAAHPGRLVQALTDQAMALLVIGDNAGAGRALNEAVDLLGR